MMFGAQEAARVLISKSGITKQSEVALLGSNYLMFRKHLCDPDCPKCADAVELMQPSAIDEYTFEVSLHARKLLCDAGIPSKVIVMPSDFMKGASTAQLEEFRRSYKIPDSFMVLLERFGVGKDDRIVVLESSHRHRAMSILRKRVLRDKVIETKIEEDGDQGRIVAGPLGRFMRIPLASVVESNGKTIRIPFCQIMCSAIYERIGKRGFTDMLGIFGESELICINQGTTLAQELGFLRMDVQISIFRQMAGGFELIGLENYCRQNKERGEERQR